MKAAERFVVHDLDIACGVMVSALDTKFAGALLAITLAYFRHVEIVPQSLVGSGGVQPPSPSLEDSHSLHLSYDPETDARKSGGYTLEHLTSVSVPEACPDSLACLRFPAGQRLPGEMVGELGFEPNSQI